jgi:hypothetical protein
MYVPGSRFVSRRRSLAAYGADLVNSLAVRSEDGPLIGGWITAAVSDQL